MIKTTDIYWLAGILEGEGSFSCSSKRNGFRPHIQLNMRDRDVVERANQLLRPTGAGVRTYKDKRPDRTPDWYEIRLTGRRAVGWMLTLYPLMSHRRQGRIRELVAQWRVNRAGSETL